MELSQKKRYAPWWVYVAIIVPANLAARLAVPEDANVLVNGACTVAVVGGLYLAITAIYRRTTAD